MRSSPTEVSTFRFLKAYRVTFHVLFRYLGLLALKKVFKPARMEDRLQAAHRKTTRQIVRAILDLKGLYIKVGQTLSMMTNFLPPAFTEGLEELQDAVPPHPFASVEKRFVADFGKTPKEMFASFDETPIASASLGQVHIARLADGTKLAVKLQYPDIDAIVQADLKTIRKIFGILNFLFPHYGLKHVYDESSKMVVKELDFEIEGKNLEAIAANFKDQPDYVFPKVFWDYSSRRVLATEFIEGTKVSNLEGLKKIGADPREVAIRLIHSYCKQIFIDGIYHADPHPGNILVQAGPKVAMVDFGATATIRPEMKAGMTQFVEGLIKKDTRVISAAMKRMGFIAKEENEETFDKVVEYFYGKIRTVKIDNFKEIKIGDFQHLNDIFELQKMDISLKELATTFLIPQDWILLERTLFLMMGLVAHLDPRLNPVDIVIPYVEEYVLGKDKKITDLIVQTSKEIILSYVNLPTELQKTLKKLQEGKISFNDKSQRIASEKIVAGIHQLIYALFLIASLFAWHWFAGGPEADLAVYAKSASIFFGVLITGSFIKNR